MQEINKFPGNKPNRKDMNSTETLLEKPNPAMITAGREHMPDRKFIEEQFLEPRMPACPIKKVLKGQEAIVTSGSSGIGKCLALLQFQNLNPFLSCELACWRGCAS
jgi:hypothetical protein